MIAESISENEISQQFSKGRALLEAGSPDLALLVTLSALEAAMRRIAGLHSHEAVRLSPAILSSFLFSRAFLNRADYEFILACAQQRDAVAHGFRQQVNKQDVERLQSIADHLLEQKANDSKDALSQTVVEIVGGESYEYTPLGQYIVKAVGVCGGRPTFKYTRIEVAGTLSRITYGESFQEILEDYAGRISQEALQEAIEVNVARGILEELGGISKLMKAA